MTGYPRPKRSFYLDYMGLPAGAVVRCKCSMGNPAFTAGWLYLVREGGQLQDNTGALVIPSARFIHP